MTSATALNTRSGRLLRVIGYAGIAIAGGMLAYALPLGSEDGVYVILCAWMGLGGVLCSVSSAFGRWVGEWIGLPMIASAMIVFAILSGRDGWTMVTVANGILLAGLALIFTARWRDVAAIYRSEAKRAKHETEAARESE